MFIVEDVSFTNTKCLLSGLNTVCSAIRVEFELDFSSLDGFSEGVVKHNVLLRVRWLCCVAERIDIG